MMPTRLREETAPGLRLYSSQTCLSGSFSWLLAMTMASAVWLFEVPVAEAQYISDNGNITRANIPSKESLDTAFDESRWHFGTLAIKPWAGIRDASFVSDQNPDDPEQDDTDFTVTAGAGIRAYVKPSPKVMVAGHVLPEYVWWQDNDERSQLNGRYGLGVFGHLNRLSFELSYRRAEEQRFFSSEVPLLTSIAQNTAKVAISLELSRGISIYAVGRDSEITGDDDDFQIFTQLDRTEQFLGAGVRLESRRGLWAEFGVEESEVEFESNARNLSNEGTTFGVGVGFDRNKLSGSVELAFRDIEPIAGSVFVPFDDVTGTANLLWSPNTSVGFLLFAQRDQTYSVDVNQSSVIGDRYGLTTQLFFGAATLQLTGAVGEDDYEGLSSIDRVDDVQEWRASLNMPVGDLFVIGLQGSLIDYDSNIPSFDRDVTSYGLSLRLGKIVEKLSLGSPVGVW